MTSINYKSFSLMLTSRVCKVTLIPCTAFHIIIYYLIVESLGPRLYMAFCVQIGHGLSI